MSPYAHNAYQQAAINVVYDKERLVVMVYEGTLRFLQRAREAMAEGRPAQKGEALSKVLALVTELDCALDHKAGGELADRLAALYEWMMRRLTEANLRNDLKALDEVETVLVELKEGFEGAAQALAPQPAEPKPLPEPQPALSTGSSFTPPRTRTLSYVV